MFSITGLSLRLAHRLLVHILVEKETVEEGFLFKALAKRSNIFVQHCVVRLSQLCMEMVFHV